MIEGEIILWAAVLGLLVGIIWALKYVIRLQQRIMDKMGITSMSLKVKKANKEKKK